MVWLVVPGTPLTMLMECLGAGAVGIGAMVGLQQLAMVLQIPGALLCGLFRRRKPFWATLALLHRVLWFLPLLFAFSPGVATRYGPRMVLGMIAVSAALAQLSAGSWNAWMADLVPEHQASRFWGTRQSILWVVYLPAVFMFGRILDAFPDPRLPGGTFMGFAWVFGLGALAGCVDILLHLKVPEPPATVHTLRIGIIRRLGLPFRNRDFTYLSLGMAAWYFALGVVGAFGILYLTRRFGLSYTQLAVLGISASLSGILSGVLWGYIMKRTGARSFCLSMLLIAPLFGASWFFLRGFHWHLTLPLLGEVHLYQPLVIQFVSGFLAGMFYCGVSLCHVNLLAVLTVREDRTLSMAVHWTLVGIGSALGPLVAGRIVDYFADHYPMTADPGRFQFGFMHGLVLIHMAIIWFVALPLMARIRVRTEDLPVGVTLARLFVGNPLRLMGNILMMDTANSRRRRAVALHGFGKQRFSLAVRDLIAQVDSPSTQVREAAVAALGNIGNREAVQALTARLSGPDPGLRLPILKALHRAADPWALPYVLAWLDHAADEVACEAIRTAGALRDRRAAGPILEILATAPATSPQRIVACAEALEALEEFSAAGDLLNRIPDLSSPILRKTVAVTCANLRTSPETFFRWLETEAQHPGSLEGELLDDLRVVVSVQRFPAPRISALLAIVARMHEDAQQHDARSMIQTIRDMIEALIRTFPVVPVASDGSATTGTADPSAPLGELRAFTARLAAMPEAPEHDSAWWECEIPLIVHLLAGALRIRRKRRRIPV